MYNIIFKVRVGERECMTNGEIIDTIKLVIYVIFIKEIKGESL